MPRASGDRLPSAVVGTLLTSRRTVDLCRVGSCLCPAC
ncbi:MULTISPECIES: putative leader peptide [unclassified Modestobacter]